MKRANSIEESSRKRQRLASYEAEASAIAERVSNKYAMLVGSDEDRRNELSNAILQRLEKVTDPSSMEEVAEAEAMQMAMTLMQQLRDDTQQLRDDKQRLERHCQKLEGQNAGLSKCSFDRLLKLHNAVGSATDSSHVKTGRVPAAKKDFNFHVDEISLREVDGIDFGETETSTALARAAGEPMECTGEAGVQLYVRDLLSDAVKYVNWVFSKKNPSKSRPPKKLKTRPECSIFSNKPDHLVVYDNDGVLFPVTPSEAKKEHENIFESPELRGQLLDCIMTGKLMHGRFSFGVLTTLNRSKVMWKDHGDCNSEALKEGRLSEKSLEDLVRFLMGDEDDGGKRALATTASSRDTQGNSTKTPRRSREFVESVSPPLLIQKPEANVGENQDDANAIAREIHQTAETYADRELFTLFCNAIVASLALGRNKIGTMKDFEAKGTLMAGDVYLRLWRTDKREKRNKKEQDKNEGNKAQRNKKGHEWCLAEDCTAIRGEWRYDKNQKDFWIVEYLGVGTTSRVWRAVVKPENSTNGYTCVVKMWIRVWDLGRDQRLTAEEIEKESSQATKAELENYQAIYGDWFFRSEGNLVGRVRLNARWCLTMPFFVPLRKKDRATNQLVLIKYLLENRFYDRTNKVSYQFDESDQRWRHVGKWGDNLLLFDLADMERKERVELAEHRRYVEAHLYKLRERMPEENAPTDEEMAELLRW